MVATNACVALLALAFAQGGTANGGEPVVASGRTYWNLGIWMDWQVEIDANGHAKTSLRKGECELSSDQRTELAHVLAALPTRQRSYMYRDAGMPAGPATDVDVLSTMRIQRLGSVREYSSAKPFNGSLAPNWAGSRVVAKAWDFFIRVCRATEGSEPKK